MKQSIAISLTILCLSAFGASQMGGCGGGGGREAHDAAPASYRIAYLYDTDLDTAFDFETGLGTIGRQVDLIHVTDASTIHPGEYGLIIVGQDTGVKGKWAVSSMADYLNSLGTPFLAIGRGGAIFYSELGLSAHDGNSMGFNGGEIYVENPADSVFSTPNNLSAPYLSLFSPDHLSRGMYIPNLDGSVEVLARDTTWTNYATLTLENNRYFFWGYWGNLSDWDESAVELFENILFRFGV